MLLGMRPKLQPVWKFPLRTMFVNTPQHLEVLITDADTIILFYVSTSPNKMPKLQPSYVAKSWLLVLHQSNRGINACHPPSKAMLSLFCGL